MPQVSFKNAFLPNRAIDKKMGAGIIAFWIAIALIAWFTMPFATLPSPGEVWRALGAGELRTLWEVVILGTLDKAFEVLRQNFAMGWTMITMVEGISRSEGGVGAFGKLSRADDPARWLAEIADE